MDSWKGKERNSLDEQRREEGKEENGKGEKLKMFSYLKQQGFTFQISSTGNIQLDICPLSHAVDQVCNYSEF
jgi:hypothetical protein